MTSRYLRSEAGPNPGRDTLLKRSFFQGRCKHHFTYRCRRRKPQATVAAIPLVTKRPGASFNLRGNRHAFEKPNQSLAVTPHSGKKICATSQDFEQSGGKWRLKTLPTPDQADELPSAPVLLDLALLTNLPLGLPPPARLLSRRARESHGRLQSSTHTLGVTLRPRLPSPATCGTPLQPHLRSARGAAEVRGRLAAGPASACKRSSRRRPRGPGPPPPSPRVGRGPCCSWGAALGLAGEAPSK